MIGRRALRYEDFAEVVWISLVIVAICLVWQAAVMLFAIPQFILPSIGDVLGAIYEEPAFLARHAAYTTLNALLGFVASAVLGVLIAVGIVYSKILDRIFFTVLALMNGIPKVALAPLFVIWLGTGMQPKIAIAMLMSIFTIVVDTVIGLRSVDVEMINMARVKQASSYHVLSKIQFPHALPHLFSGLKAAMSFAIVGAIVGEYVGGDRGLGYVILLAQGSFDTPRAFAAILILSIVATVLFYLVVIAEGWILPWHVSQRHKAK